MALRISSGSLRLGKGGGLQIAGGFNPNSISGLKSWFKADAITGKNDGDAIATWADSSGNGLDATQATGANQPLYKTGILNGKPVLRFDGTDSLASSFAAITQPTTIFVVASTRTSGTGTQFICDGVGSTNRNAIFEASGAGTMSIFSGSVVASAITGAQALSIWTALFNTTASTLRKNGTEIIAAANSGNQVLTGVRLGASDSAGSNLIGDIAEYLLYIGNVSGTNRTAVERYLSNKYAIAVA